jgi:deoxyribonuclease-4
MIRFGPGGIPLSCKGRTQRDGIEDVHTLGLNAMEIQFVRVNLFERYVADEEIGLAPRQVANEFVVDVLRGRKPLSVFSSEIKLEKGDILKTLNCGIGRDCCDLNEIGEIAADLDVALSLHAPYYMDLLGSDEIATRSTDNLRYAGLVARQLGAQMVVTHIGFYHDILKEQALERVVQKLQEVRSWYDRMKILARIGLESSGKQVIFGSLDELLAVCKRVSGLVPVLSFPHMHARDGGALKRREDFREVFDKVRDSLKLTTLYSHFSGVEHEGGNELRFTPIKKGDMRFEPLAEFLADDNPEITIISDSPLLEHDAMYMKVILERVQLKNEAKVSREEVKAGAPVKPPLKPIAPPKKKGKAVPKPKAKKAVKAPAKMPARAAKAKPVSRPAGGKAAKKAPGGKQAKAKFKKIHAKAAARKPSVKAAVRKPSTKVSAKARPKIRAKSKTRPPRPAAKKPSKPASRPKPKKKR